MPIVILSVTIDYGDHMLCLGYIWPVSRYLIRPALESFLLHETEPLRSSWINVFMKCNLHEQKKKNWCETTHQ